jgi:hypothetical protein
MLAANYVLDAGLVVRSASSSRPVRLVAGASLVACRII